MTARWLAVAGILLLSGGLAGCGGKSAPRVSRWDAYYARTASQRAAVHVIPPEGTTVPMAKLIGEYVVENLKKEKIFASLARPGGGAQAGRSFVLSGTVEPYTGKRPARYRRVLRWVLSDTNGRVVSTYSLGIVGNDRDWDFGAPQVLNSIGIGTAGPVAQMVLRETKATAPLDPLRSGLLVERVNGLGAEQSLQLTRAVMEALRSSDVSVTGDPRQASFRLVGDVTVEGGGAGFDKVRIVWRVLTMDRRELGRAEQENKVLTGTVGNGEEKVTVGNGEKKVTVGNGEKKVTVGNGEKKVTVGAAADRWAVAVPSIAKAAAAGVEYMFGTRPGPLPSSQRRAAGAPPPIALPGEPGRALPPPQ